MTVENKYITENDFAIKLQLQHTIVTYEKKRKQTTLNENVNECMDCICVSKLPFAIFFLSYSVQIVEI